MPSYKPDADLLLDVWEELQRTPDRHGEIARDNYKRACGEFKKTNLAMAKIKNAERTLREWLVNALRRRHERPAAHYRITAGDNGH